MILLKLLGLRSCIMICLCLQAYRDVIINHDSHSAGLKELIKIKARSHFVTKKGSHVFYMLTFGSMLVQEKHSLRKMFTWTLDYCAKNIVGHCENLSHGSVAKHEAVLLITDENHVCICIIKYHIWLKWSNRKILLVKSILYHYSLNIRHPQTL